VNCAEVRSLIGGYVLHALEADEAEAVRRHIADCPDCAREHGELAPVPALLDTAHDPDAEPATPPAALEDAVLDRFARERAPDGAPPRRRGARPGRRLRAPSWLARPLPAAGLAAVLAVALTLGATGVLDGGGDENGPKVYGAHLRAAAGEAPDQGTDPAPTGGDRPYAYAKLSSTDIGTRVELKASGLAGAGAVYELWCEYPDGSKVSGGTFRADENGRAKATMTTAARIGDYHRLTVEQRRPGKRGAQVLAGDIAY
jgi:Anti-sigma-K factor rskA/Putative zinc-finger